VLAEVVKAGGEPVVKWLHRIMKKIWREDRVVEEWKTYTIVPLFKKGDAEVCDNYRGISLLSIPSKVLAKILYKRIEEVVEPKIHEAQCGFRKGRGCVDQIYSLKECLAMSKQKGKELYMCFVDLRKAYDSVNRDLLWKAMGEYGVSEKTVKIVNSLYENTRAQVRVKGVLSDFLSLKTGVKQGCVLSPLLFNIFLDWVVRKVMRVMGEKGIKIRFSKQRKWLTMKDAELTETMLLSLMMYADDMVVVGDDLESVKEYMIELDTQLIAVGMMMNVKKTKMMVMNGKIETPLVIRGETVEVEEKFSYLGVSVSKDQSTAGEEVDMRISKAVGVFRALYHRLWKRKQISVETKMAIYRAAVLPVLLYDSETWVLSVKEKEKLEVFQMKCLRVILGITKWDLKRNEDIREQTGQCM
jgi:reverse transcriptase-like protein